MAPRLRCLRLSGQVNFADEILETLIAKSEARSQRAERIHDLVKDLRKVLDLAEKEAFDVSAGKGPSKLTQVLQEIQRENEWGQFYDFMRRCATITPPPPFIFRSHRHGDPFPRFEDEDTRKTVSNFASDIHAWAESDSGIEIPVSMSSPRAICDTVSDLIDEVAKHLRKTQINKLRAARNEKLHLSQLISSSGSFHWTVHTTCLKGQTATEGQEAGLAIFDTFKIKASGVPLWRGEDLLTFLHGNPKFHHPMIDHVAKSG